MSDSWQNPGLTALAFSSDSQWLGLGGYSDRVDVYSVNKGGLTKEFTVLTDPTNDERHLDYINDLAFSPSGGLLAVASSANLVLVDLTTRLISQTVKGRSNGASFSPDGESFATRRYGKLSIYSFEVRASPWWSSPWLLVGMAVVALLIVGVMFAYFRSR